MTAFTSMTADALSRRADGSHETHFPGDAIGRVYFAYDDMVWGDDGGFPGPDFAAELIGAYVEADMDGNDIGLVLDREQVRDQYGDAFVAHVEQVAFERVAA